MNSSPPYGPYNRPETHMEAHHMLKYSPFFAGIGVDDLDAAKKFYGDTLGVFQVIDIGPHLLSLQAGNGYAVLLDERPNHVPAEYTVLNFPAEDIEATVGRMHDAGVKFEGDDGAPLPTEEKAT